MQPEYPEISGDATRGESAVESFSAYASLLEAHLGVGSIIDQLTADFDVFYAQLLQRMHAEAGSTCDESQLLRAIKLFLYGSRAKRERDCYDSIISGSDCLTLAVITCTIAARKGIHTRVARPDMFTRRFHAVIERNGAPLFKVSGRKRNYGTVPLAVEVVVSRLRAIKAVLHTVQRLCSAAGIR